MLRYLLKNGPDFDFGAPPILATLKDGSQLVLAGGMDGIMRAYDVLSGKIFWQLDTTSEFETVSGHSSAGAHLRGVQDR